MTKDLNIPDFKSNWIPLRQLLKVLKEKDMWTLNTKYLNIRLDTRFYNGDYGCLIKDESGKIISLEELIKERNK